MIYIVGTGIGSVEELSQKAVELLKEADLIVGFKNSLSVLSGMELRAEILKLDIYEALREDKLNEIIFLLKGAKKAILLVAGNPLIFSYARKIMEKLDRSEYEILPAPSSVDYLAAKVKLPLNDTIYVSGHNSPDIDLSHAQAIVSLSYGNTVCYFVKGEEDFHILMERLARFKDSVRIHAGYELGTGREKIYEFSPEAPPQFVKGRWILILKPVRNVPIDYFPQNSSLRCEGIPVSRAWSRALMLDILKPCRGDTIWDLGAGSGASSIWMSLAVGPQGRIYAVERDKERFRKLCENVFIFPNVKPINADIKDVVRELPTPNKVHIGGGLDRETLKAIVSALKPGTEFVAVMATVEGISLFAEFENVIVEDTLMFSRFRSKMLGRKRTFVGEHILILLKGRKV